MAQLTEIENLHVRLYAFYWRLYCRALAIDDRDDRATANRGVRRLLLAIANSEETIAEGGADFLMKDPPPLADDPAIAAAFREHFQQQASDFKASDRRTAEEIISSLRKLDPRI